jgi:hypothetical protein
MYARQQAVSESHHDVTILTAVLGFIKTRMLGPVLGTEWQICTLSGLRDAPEPASDELLILQGCIHHQGSS